MKPKGAGAVMASRKSDLKALDFLPTPPWATRALCEHVIRPTESAWEPAAGEGHMAEVLKEYFPVVMASDVHDYGRGYSVGSFVGEGADLIPSMLFADWLITNPPFRLSAQFALRALKEARVGVALLVRLSWLEGSGRFGNIFKPFPPAIVAPFVERVPMHLGRWEPKGSTATAYAWVVWRVGKRSETILKWIPPGQRAALTKAGDVARFAKSTEQTSHGLFGFTATSEP